MADGPSKNISNFPGARWHQSNLARGSDGVTYLGQLSSPIGEIVERADGKTGEATPGLLFIMGIRVGEDSFDKSHPIYFRAIRLTEPGLTPDPSHREELLVTDSIRRYGRLTGKALEAMMKHPEVARLRRLQDWGHSEDEIQKFITADKLGEP